MKHTARLERLQRLQRKTAAEPVHFLLVHDDQAITPGTKVIRLTWGDEHEPQDTVDTTGTGAAGTR